MQLVIFEAGRTPKRFCQKRFRVRPASNINKDQVLIPFRCVVVYPLHFGQICNLIKYEKLVVKSNKLNSLEFLVLPSQGDEGDWGVSHMR